MSGLPAPLLAPWAITPQGLELVCAIASRDEFFADVRKQALLAREGKPLENSRNVAVRDGIAIIPINGPIFKHASLMSDVSGASSCESIRKDLETALEAGDVKAIVLAVDSPGGEANGPGELSKAIYESRGRKPIVSYVSGTGASAAYWIASAADKIIADPSALLGSIGVRTMITDDSKRDEAAGIKEYQIVSSQSPFKVVDPADSSDRARVKSLVSAMAEVFIADVARNRGVSIAKVMKDFGQGDVLVGEDAVRAGLADETGTLESVIEGLSTASYKSKGVAMSQSKLKAGMAEGKCSSCAADMDDDDDMYCGECYHGSKASTSFEKQAFAILGVTTVADAMGVLTGIKSQSDKLASVEAELVSVKQAKLISEVGMKLDAAVLDGRVEHAQRADMEKLAKDHGPAALDACLSILRPSASPAVIPTPETHAKAVNDGLTKDQRKIFEATGMTPEKFSAHKSKLANTLNPQDEE
jgi:signal peptide peptidase SppA